MVERSPVRQVSLATTTRVDFDQKVEEALSETPQDEDFSGWFCVSTAPFPCPAPGCDFVALYLTAAHLIMVWPRADDRDLLRIAADGKQWGREPKIIEYERSFGDCIAFDAWLAIGRPVHGQLDRTPDKPFRSF